MRVYDENGQVIKLSEGVRNDVKVPYGNKLWGASGMNIESYLAIACQACVKEVLNDKYIALIKMKDIDKEQACKIACGTNTKQWASIKKSINRMAKACKDDYNPVAVVKMRENCEDKYSNWLKLDFTPSKSEHRGFAVVPIDLIPKILKVCYGPADLDIYLTILGLTQACGYNKYLAITPRMYAKDYLNHHERTITASITRLLMVGLLESTEKPVIDEKTNKTLYTYRNVRATNFDTWVPPYERNNENAQEIVKNKVPVEDRE